MSLTVIKSDIKNELGLKSDEISIIKLVDLMIQYAYEARASDIHIDPAEEKIHVRMRIDGVLNDVFPLSNELHSEVITRLKVLSGLRTDEHQAAQDGRLRFTAQLEKNEKKAVHFDVRISIVPTYYGENAVLRLLVEQGEVFTLESLGYNKRDLEVVKRAISKPYGMILVTGPTGSGKTTSLYAILKMLNTPTVSIITIEDPIEYSLEGIDQIQVNSQTGLTFANGLRSILRQDPNIVMVGEIRDEETAKIAVNAALTGHLLLSTLHTNDAATALPRLIDMDVEPFLIASTINIIIGQRLVRKICSDCRVKKKLTVSELTSFGESLGQNIPKELSEGKDLFYAGKGCATCTNTGYLGRIGIHEVIEMTEAIREAIMSRLSAAEIKKIARSEGMTTMMEDGFQKVIKGITTIDELLRVMHE
ncbi:MAG: type II/IV secretion system protein [Candidatus Brennerbacteria bacterium]|nr:type II/IV secretion system protein [Candidatus Brennerbacteria bacterium]